MKRILLATLFIGLSSLFTFSQIQNKVFKTTIKKTGPYQLSFTPTQINGKQSLKSAKVNTNPVYGKIGATSLNIQNVKTDKTIILGQDSITPIYFERKTSKLKSAQVLTPTEKCFAFLESIRQDMHISKPSESFTITNVRVDESGQQHIRLSQKYNGIKVHNADFYVHFTDQHEIMNGRYSIINQSIVTIPEISKEEALNVVWEDIKKVVVVSELSKEQKIFLEYDGPSIDTVIMENKKNFPPYSLAYVIKLRPNFIDEWIYFIDAKDGSIIHKYNNTKFDGPFTANGQDLNGVTRSFGTLLKNGKYYLVDDAEPMFNATTGEGEIITIDAQNTPSSKLNYADIYSLNNSWSNPTAVSAHYNALQAYNYFKNTFNRNSINGKGGNIISLINTADNDGNSMANAYWNGKAIFYGNGGDLFKPLAGALDVAAHELGHAVTSNTANLEYQGQSGAMNEAFSDIFGAMVDRSNWYIGETVTNTSFISTGRLRDMSNPHNDGVNGYGWQPNHVSEIYTGTNDNGGVHMNSGIINFAYYKYATAISKDKAEQVFYRALTTYLITSSQFLDLRIAVLQSAKDLYGDNSDEVNQAKTAFDAVGIYEEKPLVASESYPVNPGQDYLLMENTDSLDPNTLYRSSVSATDFVALSNTPMKRRASVVDNGSVAVFVSDDNKLRSITLTDPPTEKIISNDAFWANAAISKDGNRVAGISTQLDTAIYVFDFITAKWAKFKLYNPTTQDNIKSGGVLYADAIEFDHTGEYLIYDSYNSLNSTTATDIKYWDIGLIKVWDNKANTFSTGEISKLFGSLPDDVSVGNPTFSKNYPNIIAFDYLNEKQGEYAIFGLNLETMDVGGICLNNTVGFPTFSKLDDKIAFSALDSNTSIINEIVLNTDKISATAAAVNIITGAQWPVYYATGTRVLGLSPFTNFTVSYKTGVAPLTVKFTDNSTQEPTDWAWTFEGGTPSTSNVQNPSVTYNSPGIYSVTLTATNSFGSKDLVKSGYIVVSKSTAIQEFKQSFSIYPNPVSEDLHINNASTLSPKSMIYIYAMDGRLVKSLVFQETIDVHELRTGLYILKIDTGSEVFQMKIVKQ